MVGDSISASEEIISHEDTSRENVFDVVDSTVTSSSNETSDNTVPSGSSSSESNSSLMEDSSQQDVQNETTDTSFEENDIAGTSTRIDRYSAYIVKENGIYGQIHILQMDRSRFRIPINILVKKFKLLTKNPRILELIYCFRLKDLMNIKLLAG